MRLMGEGVSVEGIANTSLFERRLSVQIKIRRRVLQEDLEGYNRASDFVLSCFF